MEILVLVAAIGLFNSEPVLEFVREGNGNPVYKLVYVRIVTGSAQRICSAPTGSVVLKQSITMARLATSANLGPFPSRVILFTRRRRAFSS